MKAFLCSVLMFCFVIPAHHKCYKSDELQVAEFIVLCEDVSAGLGLECGKVE